MPLRILVLVETARAPLQPRRAVDDPRALAPRRQRSPQEEAEDAPRLVLRRKPSAKNKGSPDPPQARSWADPRREERPRSKQGSIAAINASRWKVLLKPSSMGTPHQF